jgi:acyl carrier protein
MTKQEITDKILEIVCNDLQIEEKDIIPTSTFTDFGANYIDVINIIADIEKEFQICIPFKKTVNFRKINSTLVLDYIISFADYIDMILIKK